MRVASVLCVFLACPGGWRLVVNLTRGTWVKRCLCGYVVSVPGGTRLFVVLRGFCRACLLGLLSVSVFVRTVLAWVFVGLWRSGEEGVPACLPVMGESLGEGTGSLGCVLVVVRMGMGWPFVARIGHVMRVVHVSACHVMCGQESPSDLSSSKETR